MFKRLRKKEADYEPESGLSFETAISWNDRVFYILNNSLLFLVLLVMILPIMYLFANSLSGSDAVAQAAVTFLPLVRGAGGGFRLGLSFEGYTTVLNNDRILTGYANTVFYTVVGTLINMLLTILAGYPLSRSNLPGRNKIMMIFAFTMIFNGGMIPNYILMMQLGILNTRWAMLLPSAISVFNLAICRTFFKNSIPDELLEAAQMDGCSDFRFLIQIALPLSKAMLAVLSLFYAVFHWNAFFNAFLYLTDSSLFPLQLVLMDILVANTVTPDMMESAAGALDLNLVHVVRFAVIIVACLPIWAIYPFVQKYFVKGAMIGSIKG